MVVWKKEEEMVMVISMVISAISNIKALTDVPSGICFEIIQQELGWR